MKPFDVKRIEQAAQRFEQRAVKPRTVLTEAAVPAPPPWRDRRKEWLSQSLSAERAKAAVTEAEARGAPPNPDRTLASLARERIIGSNDLRDVNYLELAIAIARAVCRIRIGSASGSGSLVGPRLLMTNNHVIESVEDARQAEAQFDYQENVSGELLPIQAFRLVPDLFFLTDPKLDFTLIGVAEVSSKGRPIEQYPWLRLIGTLGKAEKGDPLNIIQHPRGGLKQIALRNNEIIEIPGGKADFLYYTTDTEPGSSGSPCFNDQWELVALHHSGVPRMENGQILKRDRSPYRDGVDDPALIDWIANEGGRISAIVTMLRSADLSGAAADLRSRSFEETPPNPVELARSMAGGTPVRVDRDGQVAVASGSSVTFSVPLNITVSFGGPQPAGATPPFALSAPPPFALSLSKGDVSTGPDVFAPEALKVDPDWSTRQGYDPDFLGITIPLPALSAAMKQNTAEVPEEYRHNDDEYVLPYHHYSLAMNKKRRFAWYSAANIDGDRRPKLPKRSDDKWHIDPRIDSLENPAIQVGEELYATAKTDRGHLTRYLDVAWGDHKAEALNALADTFHFTNCCLQLSAFNQGKDRWQGIEQYLLEKKAKKEKRRITVITGPLFKANDPVYRNEFMDYSVRIPLSFWKVCAIIREDDSLSTTAFVLSQDDVTALPGFEEAFDVTATQVTIQDLEDRTGLRFPVLRDHDHFAAGGAPGTLEIDRPEGGKRRVRPLRAYEDIVV
ncbi:MAG: DNA/RNA non-specific endonuclease [bacterium]